MALDGREQLVFRVMPREVIVDEVGVGAGTIVEQELARRLHAASVAQVTIERAARRASWTRFCFDLIQCDTSHGLHLSLIDLLEEHGVSRIALRAAYRPQVLEISAPPRPIAADRTSARARDELFAAGGPSIISILPTRAGSASIRPRASSRCRSSTLRCSRRIRRRSPVCCCG